MISLNPLNWLSGIKPTKGPLTWHQLAKCPNGTCVKFSMRSVHPYVSIEESVVGEIEDNQLNALTALIFVKPSSSLIAATLTHWHGCVRAYAPTDSARWSDPSPFSVEG